MGNKVYSHAVCMLSAPSFTTVTAYLKKKNIACAQCLLINQKQTHIFLITYSSINDWQLLIYQYKIYIDVSKHDALYPISNYFNMD